MEEEGVASRYWCHMCSLTVEPVMEAEIKCPLCRSGFVEEMEEEEEEEEEASQSLWAPVLMEIMSGGGGGGPAPARRSSTIRSIETVEVNPSRENDVDWQLQEVLRRRRRHSAAVLQIVQGIQAESGDGGGRRVMVIDPVNRTVVVGPDSVPAGSLGDYFIGPGFEALLQRLAENDPNRYGTPPAKREAVEALGTVTVDEKLQCSVCLDDFEVGSEAREMPCTHKFHSDCLLPWLELHSSCPVCRYQIPADETKTESANDGNGEVGNASASSSHGTGNGNRQEEVGDSDEEEEDADEEEEDDVSIPWPFSSLFFSSHGNNPSTDSS